MIQKLEILDETLSSLDDIKPVDLQFFLVNNKKYTTEKFYLNNSFNPICFLIKCSSRSSKNPYSKRWSNGKVLRRDCQKNTDV